MRVALAVPLILSSTLALAQPPAYDVSPPRLSFIAVAGTNPPAQVLQIRTTAGSAIRWQTSVDAPWIRLSTSSGSGDAQLDVGIDGAKLAPGRYEGRIGVALPAGPAQVVVVVTLLVVERRSGPPPSSDAAPGITLEAPAGSRAPVSSVLTLEAGPTTPESWRVRFDQPWLTTDPAAGEVPSRVIVTATPEGLPPGAHTATLVFVDGEGERWMSVPVTLRVGGGGGGEPLTIDTDVLPPATRNLPYSQAIPIRGGRPPYSIRVVEGRLPQGLVLAGGGLSGIARFAGNYPLVLAVTDASSPPQTVTRPVLLQVIVLYQDTALVVAPPSLSLVLAARQRPQGMRLAISSGMQALAWRASADAPWLRLSPERGIAPGVLQLDVDAAALEPGTYTATVTITMEGAPNSPARVPVQVVVRR